MDEYGGITFDEAVEAIKSITEQLYSNGNSEQEELYGKILYLTDKKFADEVTDIVAAEHNTYSRLEQIRRMNNIIDMLAYGLSQEKVKEIVELRLDDFAVDFIRWKGL